MIVEFYVLGGVFTVLAATFHWLRLISAKSNRLSSENLLGQILLLPEADPGSSLNSFTPVNKEK